MVKDVNLDYVTEEFTLNASVADNGTFTVNYPSGWDRGDFENAGRHYIMLNGDRLDQGKDVTMSFGASSVTVTNVTGAALAAGKGHITLFRGGTRIEGLTARARIGTAGAIDIVRVNAMGLALLRVDFGSPIASDADYILNDQSATDSAKSYTTSDFETTYDTTKGLDVPRTLTATGTAGSDHVVTVTGRDEYGQTMVEALTLNGTNVIAGKKAFKFVDSVAVAAGAAGDTFDLGIGDILGLPVRIARTTDVFQQFEDGAKVGDFQSLSGTVVAGLADNTEGTATTADVRGTWDTNTAADGAVSFEAWIVVDDPTDIGNPQYSG